MIKGLERAIEIIKAERIEAKEINPTMAFGMSHVLRMVEEELVLQNTKL